MLPNKNKDYRKSVTNSVSLNHIYDLYKQYNYTQKLDDEIIINARPNKRGIDMIQIKSKQNQHFSDPETTLIDKNFKIKSKRRK